MPLYVPSPPIVLSHSFPHPLKKTSLFSGRIKPDTVKLQLKDILLVDFVTIMHVLRFYILYAFSKCSLMFITVFCMAPVMA